MQIYYKMFFDYIMVLTQLYSLHIKYTLNISIPTITFQIAIAFIEQLSYRHFKKVLLH